MRKLGSDEKRSEGSASGWSYDNGDSNADEELQVNFSSS